MIAVGQKTELCELAEKWGTDKYLYYTPFYHSLLNDRRATTRKVLELGVGSPATMLDSLSRVGRTDYITGASLYMWEEYFPCALIHGLDINPETFIDKERIRCFYCDQRHASTYPLLERDFDLIVEDGLHEKEAQRTAIETLVPLLAEGGIYIAEDCGYMTRRERAEFSNQLPYLCEIHEFHNPALGNHIAAVMVIRK